MRCAVWSTPAALVSAGLLTFGLAFGVPSANAQSSDKVRVGFLSTLSGPQADLGQRHLDGFRLALELAGGKIGGVTADIVTADDKLNPEVGVQMGRKFVDSDKVDFVTGIVFSNVMMAAYKPVVEKNVLVINSFAGPSPLSGELCNPFLFGAGIQNDTTYEAVGKYVAAQTNIKNVFIIAPNYQGGKDAVAGFKRYYKGQVAGEIYTRLGQPDYAGELAQIRSAKPDAVYFFYPGSMGITFVRQFHAAKLEIPMYSGFSVEETTIHAMGEAAAGAYSAAVYNDDLDNPANAIFAKAYTAKYKRRPSIYSALGYDVVQILDRAVSAVKGDLTKKDEMRKALRETKFSLVRGPMQFNTNQFPIQNFYLVQAEKGTSDFRMVYRSIIFEAHKDSYSEKCSMK
jgi:branched-chain amino acid transport system substrate-binding protein